MLKISKIILVAVFAAGVVTCSAITKHIQTTPPSPRQLEELNPYPISSPAHRERGRILEWLMANEKLGLAAATPSLPDRSKLAAQLMGRGMGRLSDDLLEKYLPIVSKLLASLDDTSCGKFVKGSLSPSEVSNKINNIISGFSDAEANTWFAVEKSAIEAELNGTPLITITNEELQDGILKLAASLPDQQGRELLLKLQGYPAASYNEACVTARILYSRGSALAEPYRGHVARSLLTVRTP